ncbi:hypothetical protein SAMN04488058_10434 [Deinococcus reticulitermitis]|uniref:Uncharacterized protein n=1 Tax=Deinococcus reticulitermitis TaxID=856736 RepID=A0A1H6WFI8_9DEIO|nr:hypothetical protein [Deinococcus reticulitermitis]SEJ11272.1 hypothetical protein SAMN04488058_10434 [Deinococcus reticulitermitis]
MTQPRSLETSEIEFTDTYAAFAAAGELYPQREGSPLLEFAAGGRVLYLFDRCGPYAARPGPARVIVHGVLDPARVAVLPAGEHEELLHVQGISAVEGVGQVTQAGRRVWVVQARLPLVLAAFDSLPGAAPGDWVSFATVPPLHGFVVTDGLG